MKKALILFLLGLFVFIFWPGGGPFAPVTVAAAAGETPPAWTAGPNGETGAGQTGDMQKELESLDLSAVDKYLTEINRDIRSYIPELNIKELLYKLARGEIAFSLTGVFTGLLKYLFREVVANSRLLGQLMILAVFCAVLQNVQSAFEKGAVGKVAWAVCYLVLFTIALGSFAIAARTGRDAIENMISFMHAMLPVLITLLTAMGNLTSAALFQPLTLMVLTGISTLIKNIIFPLIFFAAVLGLASNISERFQVSKLAKLLQQWTIGLLGLFLTIFMGFLAVQGVAGSVADGIAIRTAKYTAGAFIPVVGKMLSDALEAVVGTSLLLKNAVGLVGVLAVFFMCAFPVLKILSLALIYKFTAAVLQPISDNQVVGSLNTMGNSLMLVFAAVISVGLMFFFVIAIVVGAGNFSTMLR
ncbi:MAG: stage III sporulation protein AE [Bacillota bacterium]